MVFSTPMESHDRDADVAVRAIGGGAEAGGERQGGGSGERGLEEGAAIHLFHNWGVRFKGYGEFEE